MPISNYTIKMTNQGKIENFPRFFNEPPPPVMREDADKFPFFETNKHHFELPLVVSETSATSCTRMDIATRSDSKIIFANKEIPETESELQDLICAQRLFDFKNSS